MTYRIAHPTRQLNCEISPVASKSESNRALIIRAISDFEFGILNLSAAEDTCKLESILSSIEENMTVDCGNSGTVLRFLTAYFSTLKGIRTLTGSERMKNRPVKILVDALRELGAEIIYLEQEGFPPIRITGKKLSGKELKIDGSVSSQYISALLLIAPDVQNGLSILVQNETASEPYINMTLKMMAEFGAEIGQVPGKIKIGEKRYSSAHYKVEADWSAAAFWYEIAALSTSPEIFLKGFRQSSWQGDQKIVEFMKYFGVETEYRNDGIWIKKNPVQNQKDNLEFNLFTCPDLAPALFATCAGLNLNAIFTGLKNLKIKESDRMLAMKNELRKTGAVIESPDNDALIFKSSENASSKTIRFSTYDDHRVAMALAPLALLYDQVEIEDPDVVSKSYPDYWKDLQKAGFEISAL